MQHFYKASSGLSSKHIHIDSCICQKLETKCLGWTTLKFQQSYQNGPCKPIDAHLVSVSEIPLNLALILLVSSV